MAKKDVYVRIMKDGFTVNPYVFVMNNIVKNPPQRIIDICGKPFGKKKQIVCILATEEEANDARENGMLMESTPSAIKPEVDSIDMNGPRVDSAPGIKNDADNGGWLGDDDPEKEPEPVKKAVKKKAVKKTAKKKAKKKTAKKKTVRKKTRR